MPGSLTREQFLERIPGARGSFLEFVSFDVVAVDAGEVELAVTVAPQHRNTGGILHGGVAMGLLDIAGALAVVDDIETEFGMTLTQSTRFAAPATGTALWARARRTGGGRRIRFAEGMLSAERDSDPLVVAAGTYKVVARAG